MRPALLIVGAVLLVLGHLELVHQAYYQGFQDAQTTQEKNPTVEVGPKGLKETHEVRI